MNLRAVGIIAAKELKDVLRDRRTLIFMMLLPIAVMPLGMVAVKNFIVKQTRAKEARVLNVALNHPGRVALKALADNWLQQNTAEALLILAKVGVEAAGGGDQILDRLNILSGGSSSTGGDLGGVAGAAIAAYADLSDEDKQLLSDFQAVKGFRKGIKWVDFEDLAEAGDIASGVEIPDGLPDVLADPRVTFAVQSKQIEAAMHLPRDALIQLEEALEALEEMGLALTTNVDSESERIAMLQEAHAQLRPLRALPVYFLYDSSQSLSKEAFNRFDGFLAAFNRYALKSRLDFATLPPDFAEPMTLEQANVATRSRTFQAIIGGLLPYLLFGFCFFGALYPALDVTAGEKERFTLETLLLGPVSRLDIALGKFLVVFAAAIVAALLTTTSMVVTITHWLLPPDMLEALDIEFQPMALLMTGSLILPVAAMYAALLLAVGLYARSFKEAQSYTVPLQLLLVLPTLVALLPDVEAESHLAWIPFVNIAMLMKELLKGNYLWQFYWITLASMLVLTVASLIGASTLFRRESVLLRT